MRIIKSLKKEKVKNARKSLGKLKLKKNDEVYKNLKKIANYIGNQDLKDFDLDSVSNYMRFQNYHVEIKCIQDESRLTKLVNTIYKNEESKEVFKITVFNTVDIEKNSYMDFYTIPTIKKNLDPRCNYSSCDERFKVVDIRYLYGILKMIDIVYSEVTEKEDIYFFNFAEYNVSHSNYSKDILNKLISFPFSTRFNLFLCRGMSSKEYKEVSSFIIDVMSMLQVFDLNSDLTEKYEKEGEKQCARAFETKKNIPKDTLHLMNTTRFLEDFKYVEIDEDTSLDILKEAERQWKIIKEALGLKKFIKKDLVELRFKKLGKHRANGLYYPSLYCICTDIRNTSAFLHEFAHCIDFTYEENPMSIQPEFFNIINEYRFGFEKEIAKVEDDQIKRYLKRKRDYFFTPTEIFARSFEMYLNIKGFKTSFNANEMSINGGYIKESKKLNELITNYFDKVIDKVDCELIKISDEDLKKKIMEEEQKVYIEMKQFDLRNAGEQLGFAI